MSYVEKMMETLEKNYNKGLISDKEYDTEMSALLNGIISKDILFSLLRLADKMEYQREV